MVIRKKIREVRAVNEFKDSVIPKNIKLPNRPISLIHLIFL